MCRNTDARCLALAAALGGLAAAVALAFPEGAPWGTADPEATETCSSCHYDYEPQRDSASLDIDGLPAEAVAGCEYALRVRFTAGDAAVSGFQLVAAGTGGPAGVFRSADDGVETIGAAARSTRPAARDGDFRWSLRWQAPGPDGQPVVLYLAASAANDDRSPFGDTIHYRRFVVPVSSDDGGDSSCRMS